MATQYTSVSYLKSVINALCNKIDVTFSKKSDTISNLEIGKAIPSGSANTDEVDCLVVTYDDGTVYNLDLTSIVSSSTGSGDAPVGGLTEIPMATSTTLGGIIANAISETDTTYTTEVKIDENGKLYVPTISGAVDGSGTTLVNVSQLINDAGYITSSDIPTVPTKVSELENDANYLTEAAIPTKMSELTDDVGYLTEAEIPTKVSQLENDSDYVKSNEVPSDLGGFTNNAGYALKSQIPTQTSQLENNSNLAYVSQIPTAVSQLENDANYLTEAVIPTKVSELENDLNFLTDATIPDSTSDLTNDSGFITIDSVPTKVSELENDLNFLAEVELPTKVSQLENDSNYIAQNQNISLLTNDAGYITSSSLPTDLSQLSNANTKYISENNFANVLETNQSTIDHTMIGNVGSFSHADLDAHIENDLIHSTQSLGQWQIAGSEFTTSVVENLVVNEENYLVMDTDEEGNYYTEGSLITSVFDTSTDACPFKSASYFGVYNTGLHSIKIYTRTGTTDTYSGSTWEDWKLINSNGTINSTANRYLQVKIEMSTANEASTPVLKKAIIYYGVDMAQALRDGMGEYPDLNSRFTAIEESAFSGDYNDLTNQPEIPSIEGLATETYVTEAIAENGFDKDSYYTKEETYSKVEVDQIIWEGTQAEYETALANGEIVEGTVVHITDDEFEDIDLIIEQLTPKVSETTGNWLVNNIDTGVNAEGKDGKSIISIVMDDDNNVIVGFDDNTTVNLGHLKANIQGDFLTSDGFGNLRFYNSKLQYYDTNSSTWVDTDPTAENSVIISLTPQHMQSLNIGLDRDNQTFRLKWKEPTDTIADGQALCLVENVMIRRKLGSEPIDTNDGDLVINVKRSEFGSYANEWYVDRGLTANVGEVWFYKAFPISTNSVVSNSSVNVVSMKYKEVALYGFKIDQNESDPASMITYLEDCDNSGYQSAYMDYDNDTFNYGDWADAWFIKECRPCMLKYDGTVDYYLNPNDYTLKEDGTESDVANADYEGNAMIEFPKVYYKIIDNGDDTANVYISDTKLDDDYVCWSHIDNNGNEIDYCYMAIYNGYYDTTRLRSISGQTHAYNQTATSFVSFALANNLSSTFIWNGEVLSDRILINLLLLLIGRSTDTQTIFGNGYCSGGSETSNPRLETGTMDDKGLFWGTNDMSMTGVKVFGIENYWGNAWRRTLGYVYSSGIQKIKLTYGQFDSSLVEGYNFTGEGYLNIPANAFSGSNPTYISKMLISNLGFYPSENVGSETTYYTDGLYYNNSITAVASFGGRSNAEKLCGAFYTHLNWAVDNKDWSTNMSISCKPLAQ